jgi:hypothetical protein
MLTYAQYCTIVRPCYFKSVQKSFLKVPSSKRNPTNKVAKNYLGSDPDPNVFKNRIGISTMIRIRNTALYLVTMILNQEKWYTAIQYEESWGNFFNFSTWPLAVLVLQYYVRYKDAITLHIFVYRYHPSFRVRKKGGLKGQCNEMEVKRSPWGSSLA